MPLTVFLTPTWAQGRWQVLSGMEAPRKGRDLGQCTASHRWHPQVPS